MNSLSLSHPVLSDLKPALRGLTIMPLSALVTLALLFIMLSLIRADEEVPFVESDPTPIANVHMKPAPPIETLPPAPERPEAPEVKPQMPLEQVTFTPAGPGEVTWTRVAPSITITQTDIYVSDQIMPMIKVNPNYPTSASTRGIEGFVEVMFDVTAMGTTENIRIVHAEPERIFNSSVLAAIKRWKYKPRVVNGEATPSYDVRERLVFKLED